MSVFVRDMEIGKKYKVNGVFKTLTNSEITGAGGSGFQEPYYTLVFDNDNNIKLTKDWDFKFEKEDSTTPTPTPTSSTMSIPTSNMEPYKNCIPLDGDGKCPFCLNKITEKGDNHGNTCPFKFPPCSSNAGGKRKYRRTQKSKTRKNRRKTNRRKTNRRKPNRRKTNRRKTNRRKPNRRKTNRR
jgi:hypothetical protein